MKQDWKQIGKQISTFITFYCAVFTSVILSNIFINGHNPVHVTNADLIIPAVSSLAFVLIMSRQRKSESSVIWKE